MGKTLAIVLTIAIQRHLVEGVGPKETLDLLPNTLSDNINSMSETFLEGNSAGFLFEGT